MDRCENVRSNARRSVIALRTVTGSDVGPWLADVARLRIAVFREYPYLYEGDTEYEQGYLQTYARSAGSLFVLALDGTEVVGASTAIPLADETAEIRQPFVDAGIDINTVCYFGESVLLPKFRGRGVGGRFFDLREAHASKSDDFALTAFCTVIRDPDDPRRPPEFRGNQSLWTRRGYSQRADMQAQLHWKEIGQAQPSAKRLRFWLRDLP